MQSIVRIIASMLIDRIRPLPRSLFASLAISVAGGALYFITAGKAPDEAQAAPVEAGVLVSMGLLDMSRLGPAQFGDWEPAASQRSGD
jgi:hypothetical protein